MKVGVCLFAGNLTPYLALVIQSALKKNTFCSFMVSILNHAPLLPFSCSQLTPS